MLYRRKKKGIVPPNKFSDVKSMKSSISADLPFEAHRRASRKNKLINQASREVINEQQRPRSATRAIYEEKKGIRDSWADLAGSRQFLQDMENSESLGVGSKHSKGSTDRKSRAKHRKMKFDEKAFLKVYNVSEKGKHSRHSAWKNSQMTDPEFYETKYTCMLYVDGAIANTLIGFIVLFAIAFAVAELFDEDINGQRAINATLFAVFVVEFLVRFIAYGCSIIRRPMVWLDVLSMILDAAALGLNSPRLHLFRVLRFGRIARIGKVTKHWVVGIEENRALKDQREKIVVENQHITWYLPRHLFSHGWFVNSSGTILWSRQLWVQSLMLMILSTIWAAHLCDTSDTLTRGDFAKCAVPIGDASVLIFTVIAAIFGGVFTYITLTRWWETRKAFTKLAASSRELLQMMISYIPGNDHLSSRFRNLMRRLQLSAFILVTQGVRCDFDLDLLQSQGLLTDDESSSIETVSNGYYIVYCWMRSYLWQFQAESARLFMSPVASMFCAEQVDKCIQQQQLQIGEIFALVQTQVPYIFVHLITLVAKVQLIVLSLWAGTFIRYGHDNESYAMLVWGYVLIIFSSLAIEGMLQMHSSLFSPFGYDAVDFPLHIYVQLMMDISRDMKAARIQLEDEKEKVSDDVA
eukprot:CAMPEP_0167743872 /NCGR_PEP_ID=MMETSP0110_2-20121227/2257_1 /TAXON_ID=629695 /ORGANISM="Gymnochlora sp., Strain CCMP2014" /LENGTH=635 /DNA_ID=CAMNT_0007628291 /DNA_START=445 /DNA_END=2349 /DNA_ORIENTATION=+